MQLLELTEDEKKLRSHETMQKSRKSRTSYCEKCNCKHVGLICVYDLLVFEGSSCLQLQSGTNNNKQGIGQDNLTGTTWFVNFKHPCLSLFGCICSYLLVCSWSSSNWPRQFDWCRLVAKSFP